MLRFCQICGGLPVEYTSGTRELKFSVTGVLWSSILVILQEVLPSIALYSYFNDTLDRQSLHPMARTTDLALTLHVVSLQVVFLSSVRMYPILIDVFDTLERVYGDLQQKTSEVKTTVKFWGICIVLAVSSTIAEHINSVIDGRTTVSLALSSLMEFTVVALLNCSQAALFVHFTHVTTSIAKAFRTVTDMIEKEITSNIIGRREHNLPNVGFNHTSRTLFLTMEKLKTLMNNYWMICDATHKANVFYCVQLMAVTFSSFVHVTLTSYSFFMYVRDGNVFAMLSEGAWIITHIYYVVVLVNSGTDVTDSADETGQLICKLINKNMDPVLRKQLEGCLLQLPYHNARFSALGYFPIHNETLTVMAGAVTTYLVIMIQFQTQPPST